MTWVNFQTVRENLDFAEVLAHFGFQTKANGQDQVKIHCPFHDDSNPSCGVNLSKKVFQCWSCKAKGNVLDFFAKMEGFDPDEPKDLRKAALQAVEVFGIDGGKQDAKSGDQPKAKAKPAKRAPKGAKRVEEKEAAPIGDDQPDTPSEAQNEPANKPLTFELQLDASHPYLEDRGLTKAQIKTFGLGVAKRGSMQGRLCFPIHNEDGALIAYSGRWVEDKLPKDTPRYKLPKGFEKARVLFNLHRVLADAVPETVVIVEGFWSVLRLHAAGVPVVSCFGASLSEAQADLLVDAGVKNCTLIFDGDDGGRAGALHALPILAKRLFVRTIVLEEGIKPDTMDEALLRSLPRC